MATKNDPQAVSNPDTPAQSTKTDDMRMSPEDFAELRAQAAQVSQSDVHLGRFLTNLLGHLGHAHGLDAAAEDKRLAKEARARARKEEDERLKREADDRAKGRLEQDAIERTPEQKVALQASRAAEDAQLKADATEREKKRAEEDKAAHDAEANA